jgi:hypothetical protein
MAHDGHHLEWDWSNKGQIEDDQSIRCAAFCEHEVKEVKTGHPITLTYRLYVHERVGDIMRKFATHDLSSTVSYHRVIDTLASLAFMRDGQSLNLSLRFIC